MSIKRLTTKRLAAVATVGAFAIGWAAYLIWHQAAGDFWVYWGSVDSWFHGQDVYAATFHGHTLPPDGMSFTYTPFALFVLAPLGFWPWQVSVALWTLVSVTIMWVVVARLTPATRHRSWAVFGLLLAVVVEQIGRQNLFFTQINLALMALVLGDLWRPEDHRSTRWLPRGVLIGLATAVKLTPALFIVFFLLTKQWRLALWSTISAGVATLVAFAVMPAKSWWFWTHVTSLQDRVSHVPGGTMNPNNNSIHGVFNWCWPDAPHLVVTALVGLTALAAMAAAVYVYRAGRAFDAALIVGVLIPIISPVGWVHHYAFAIPAAMVLLFRLSWTPLKSAFAAALFAVLTVGPDLGDQMVHGPAWAWPLGAICRESALLTGVTVIVALVVSGRGARESGSSSPR